MNHIDSAPVLEVPRKLSRAERAQRERDRQLIADIASAAPQTLAPREPAAADSPPLRALPLVVPGLALLLCASILLIWSTVL